jgi:glycosyltransferase involved in cell wall biosynthesis
LTDTSAASALNQIETQKVDVSIIMPAYNEEEHITHAIQTLEERLRQTPYSYEIIVVDDGSTDGTRREALRVAKNPRVRVLGYARNMGKGHAIKYGVLNSNGNIVTFMDSDMEIKPEGIELYLSALEHADFVFASKRHPNSFVKQPATRKFLSYAFNAIVRLMLGIDASDTQTGFKAFKGEKIKKLMPLLSVKKYAFDVEVLMVARLMRLRGVEMPVRIELGARFSMRAVVRMFIDLLGIAYRLRVKRWYQKNLNGANLQYRPIIRW